MDVIITLNNYNRFRDEKMLIGYARAGLAAAHRRGRRGGNQCCLSLPIVQNYQEQGLLPYALVHCKERVDHAVVRWSDLEIHR